MLKEYFDSLPADKRDLQLGRACDDPLRHAFDSKRVVHAGVNGKPLAPEESQQVWKEMLAMPPDKKEIRSAYIHIPFCQTKCLYCGFFQNATNQSVEDHYIDCLIDEIEREAESPLLKDGLIHALFIGGGTPTSLSPHNAERLLQTIHNCIPLANDYELTLEGRIHDLVPEKMDVWMANGVNRMSLGVQSFDTHVRQQLKRIDDQETVLRRLAELKSYQQCSVVIDLIYGLPDQTKEVWQRDLELLEESGIDGMDIYQLNVFEGSDLDKRIQAGQMSRAASTAEQADMYMQALEFIEKRPFTRLSVCHWRRNNRERSLYNTLTKKGVPMFPFGCGAGGNLGSYSTMLHRSLKPYEAMVEAGQKPFMALIKKSPLQPIFSMAIDQLEQCYFDLRPLVKEDAALQELKWLLDTWTERGLMTYNGLLYKLTPAGEFWHVNLSQTVVECIQRILTGTNDVVQQKVAAQDKKENSDSGKDENLMRLLRELMDGVPDEELRQLAAQMPNHVKDMIQAMPKAMVKEMMKTMAPDHIKAMMKK